MAHVTVAPYVYVTDSFKGLVAGSGHDSFTVAFITGYRNGKAVWDAGVEPDKALLRTFKNCILSFGGAGSTTNELAGSIRDVNKLADAYMGIMAAYGATTLDFDVEGSSASQTESIDRRNRALSHVQNVRPSTVVNYTLAVMPFGLDATALNILKSAQKYRVKVNLVNLMVMDYGQRIKDMGKAAIDAANSVRKQLDSMGLRDVGIGLTPMIGSNDTADEVFTQEDARQVRAFADQTPWLRLLGFWSLNRDNGSKVSTKANDSYSGVRQTPFEFTKILASSSLVLPASSSSSTHAPVLRRSSRLTSTISKQLDRSTGGGSLDDGFGR